MCVGVAESIRHRGLQPRHSRLLVALHVSLDSPPAQDLSVGALEPCCPSSWTSGPLLSEGLAGAEGQGRGAAEPSLHGLLPTPGL